MPGPERPGGERRRASGEFRGSPRASPAAQLVLTVTAVLLVVATAAALMGRGPGPGPQGRLLAALSDVAEAQEAHYHASGRFTDTAGRLPGGPPGAELVRLRVVGSRWEAALHDPQAGLTCSQAGGSEGGRVVRHPPTCYTVE